MFGKFPVRSSNRAARLFVVPFASFVAVVVLASLQARADDWTPLWTTATLPHAVNSAAEATVDRKVLFAGGYNSDDFGGVSNVVDVYDTTAGTWSTVSLSQARSYPAGVSTTGQAVFAGGFAVSGKTPQVDIYSGATLQSSSASLSAARDALADASLGARAFFGGGQLAGGTPSAAVDIYDASAGTWSKTSLSQARYYLAAASRGGKVLFGGGYALNGDSAVVDIYDSSTNRWSITKLSQARSMLSAAGAGNFVLFAGGQLSNDTQVDTVDIYNISSGSWSTAHLSQARHAMGAASVGSKVLFAGGWPAGYGFPASDVVDIYDTSTGKWSTSHLSQARSFLGAVTLGNQVFFGGGAVPESNSNSSVVDIYTLQNYSSITSSKYFALQDNTMVTGRMQLSGGSLGLGAYTLAVGSMAGNASVNLGSGALTAGNDNTTTNYSGTIQGTGRFIKTGSGALLLSGSSTYTGPTTITQGKLIIDGWLTNSAFSVNGGTLGGTGYLSGGTVDAGGTLAPGDPQGILHMSGNLVLAAGAAMDFELDTPDGGDELQVYGLATLDGTLNVSLVNGFTPSAGESFDLISGRTAGSFTQINLPSLSDGLRWGTSSLYTIGEISVVPEPSALLLLGVGALGLGAYAWRKRRLPRETSPEG